MIKEEAIEMLLCMSDSLKEIAEFMGAPPEKPLTLEEVRAELSKLSRAGKTPVVKQILGKFGVSKLSDLKPSDYWALMAMAQEATGSGATGPEANNA